MKKIRSRFHRIAGLAVSLALVITSMSFSTAVAESAAFDNPFYRLDEQRRTISEIYEGTAVETFQENFIGDWTALVSDQEGAVTSGTITAGMTVEIFRKGELFGTYTVAELESAAPQLFSSNGYGFCSPFEGRNPLSNVTQEFGGSHKGIDLAWTGIDGTAVRAVKSGTVEQRATDPNSTGWGNYIRIGHGGISTLYAHMKWAPLVKTGDYVVQGQVIGYVGSTGDSSGPHLHFEVYLNGTRVNPRPYLTGAGEPDFVTPDHQQQYGRIVSGDFNGDGKDDIATMYDDGNQTISLHVFASNGSSFSKNQWWLIEKQYNAYAVNGRMVAGDFNGDGYDDIAVLYDYETADRDHSFHVFLSNGSSFSKPQTWYKGIWYSAQNVTGRFVAGDFNGDGKDDIVALYDYGNSEYAVHTFVSSGSSFSAPQTWLSDIQYSVSNVTGRVVAGDFNGDGKDDIAAMYDYGSNEYTIHTFVSSGSSFSKPQWWLSGNQFNAGWITGRMVAGNFSNDASGRESIACLYDYHVSNSEYAAFYFDSHGGSFTGAWKWAGGNIYPLSNVTGLTVAGDFNGDGRDDIATMYDYGGSEFSLHTFLSTPSGFDGPHWWLSDVMYNVGSVTNTTPR